MNFNDCINFVISGEAGQCNCAFGLIQKRRWFDTFCEVEVKISSNYCIEFLDKENFSVTFRSGVWTKQKFHTKETLHNALEPYFEEITIYGTESRSNIYAICKKPIRWDLAEYKKALDIEFNMTYPKGFKHNQHEELVMTVLK